MISIGIVGAGFLAETRARAWARVPGARVLALTVAARRADRARAFAERHHISAHDSVDELLEDPLIDLVDLCVPNRHHRSLAEAAARHGKHVLCTKPLAAYVGQDLDADAGADAAGKVGRERMLEVARAEASAMVAAARSSRVRLFYGENWIFAPAIVRARSLLAASKGRILEMRGWECHSGSHSPYSKTWSDAGGGALLRLGAHPIGAMLFLKHEEGLARDGRPIRPVSVTAEVADLARVRGLAAEGTAVATGWRDVESWGCAMIAFEDGSRGVAYGSDAMLGGMQSQLTILASDAHLHCRLSPSDMLQAYAPNEDVFAGEYLMEKLSTRSGWSTPMADEDWTSGHVGMCAAVARALLEGEPFPSDGELGAEVVDVVYAAYQSAEEGRRVVLVRREGSAR